MSKTQRSPTAKPKQDAACIAAVERPAAMKVVVLGQVKARGGKMYQVLEPAVTPRHLSMDDIERAVEMMVAAR